MMNKRIIQLTGQMQSNLQQKFSTKRLAKKVNVSDSRLRQLFITETGMSPTEYLRDLRLERAAQLLADSLMSIKEIGEQVGIRDKSHFTKYFKEKFGVTPSDYRKKFGKNTEGEKEENL